MLGHIFKATNSVLRVYKQICEGSIIQICEDNVAVVSEAVLSPQSDAKVTNVAIFSKEDD